MPVPRLGSIATLGYTFACLNDRAPRGGCGWYDADGHYHSVTNLDWLLREAAYVYDIWVAFGGADHDHDALIGVRLTEGRVYVATFQSREILHRWLNRPRFQGRTVHWNRHAYIVGSRDYKELEV